LGQAGLCLHIQFENPWHSHYGLPLVPVLEHREFHGFRTIHKQTTAQSALIAGDPMAISVSSDQKKRSCRGAQRGRFAFVHRTSSFALVMRSSFPMYAAVFQSSSQMGD
jgi:hypothetical protein